MDHWKCFISSIFSLAHPRADQEALRSIEPLIFLSNREASLIGGGRVVSENDSPRGVVSVGSRDLANKRQVTLTRIDGIKIQGAGTTDSVGLNLDSLEPVTGDGTGANYMGSFSNIVIQNVGTGVRIGKLCNGHTFCSIFFLGISQFSYFSEDNSENTFLGGFTHLSHGVTVIRLKGVIGHNLFYGVQAEPGKDKGPGARDSVYFEDDEECQVCQVFGQENVSELPLRRAPVSLYLSSGILEISRDLIIRPNVKPSVKGDLTQHITKDRTWTLPDQSGSIPLQAVPQPSSTASSVDQLRDDFNALLEKLRSSGILAGGITPDPCKALEDAVNELQGQVTNMQQALDNGEIPPPPRTPEQIAKVKARIVSLEDQLSVAQAELEKCRQG